VSAVPQVLPDYLASLTHLTQFFEGQFDGLDPRERGRRFARLVQRVVPLSEVGRPFGALEARPESHDGGVDLISETVNGQQLCVQSKYRMSQKADLDSVISHFEDFDAKLRADGDDPQASLFATDGGDKPTFILVTSSPLDGIRKKYEDSSLASVGFYRRLLDEGRLTIIDGEKLLTMFQRSFRRQFDPPSQLLLRSQTGWLPSPGERVLIGFVAAQDLVQLYNKYGDALFFENVREFLGIESTDDQRSAVNGQIVDTIRSQPERMAGRNNGITIGGVQARFYGDDRQLLVIDSAGIVNGCQTTMCLVHVAETDKLDSHVVVKVVIDDDSWGVARAANHQNLVSLRDLDVARFVRPQLMRKVSADLGIGLYTATPPATTEALESMLDTIGDERVAYDDVRYVFFGLLCNKPNQLFRDNYDRLDASMLEALQAGGEDARMRLFRTLFEVVREGRRTMDRCEADAVEVSGHLLSRLKDSKYFAYITILAMGGALETSDFGHGSAGAGLSRLLEVIEQIGTLVENHPDRFGIVFEEAYKIVVNRALDSWTDDATQSQVRQVMTAAIIGHSFDSLRQQVSLNVRMSDRRAGRLRSED
jgi:hypothetical protein